MKQFHCIPDAARFFAARTFLPLAALLPTVINIGCAQAQTSAGLPAPVTNVAKQSEPGAPFINTWLLLGTFDNDAANAGYNRAFIDETNAAPQDGQSAGGQSWRYFDDRLFSRNYDNYNDLFSYFDIKQKASVAAKVVYAHSYVYSPSAQNVQLRVGADTGFKAWINGAQVAASTQAGSTMRAPGENQVLNGGRDFVVVPGALNVGWNRLLLKVSNVENGRFGFYARFTTSEGNAPRGLEYSVSGGGGALAIENRAMPEAKTGALPVAWREWPYVEAQPDIDKILKLSADTSGPNGQKPAAIPGIGIPIHFNRGTGMSASAFKLTARGGKLPVVWSKTKGALPSGMTLKSDGTISGTPTESAKLGAYTFTSQVRDAAGKAATREYSLTLRERPNRAIETGRLIGLIHGPESVAPADMPKLARQMQRQGYHTGVPIMYHNGDRLFRWPTKWSKHQTPTDVAALYKKTLEDHGIAFGAYAGPFDDSNEKNFSLNQQGLVMQELLNGYAPKVLWFDWLGGESSAVDSLFSIARSIDPNIVIIMNGSERMAQGDWDIMNFEGWGAWGSYKIWDVWPAHFPWPKKQTPSSWRPSVTEDWTYSLGTNTDWREMLRVQLSIIGEGFIADIDHSASGIAVPKDSFDARPTVIQHEKMAKWTTRPGLPPLHEAFTKVDPGPLAVSNYGYNTINLKRDALFLLALENPHGKVGLPRTETLRIGAIPSKVTSVTLMNTGKKIPFSQHASTRVVTLDIKGIKRDEIADIIKIALEKPLTPAQAKPPFMPSLSYGAPLPSAPVPEGNIAMGKPSWLMSADDSRELMPSSRFFAIYGVDGNPKTMAMAGHEWAWSYKVDLQKEATIRRVVVNFDQAMFATDYHVLVSIDGKKWTRVVEVADGQPDSGPGEHTFNIAPVKARFIRVRALKPDGPNQKGLQMPIRELQVFETAKAGVPITPMPARLNNLALGKPSQILSMDGTRVLESQVNRGAALGVDDDPTTFAIATGEWPWTYEVDLQKTAPLRGVSIAFGLGVWATDYNVLVSRDRQTWKPVVAVAGNNFNGVKSHSFAPTEARYVRVQALQPDGPGQIGSQMSIAELQVFDKE